MCRELEALAEKMGGAPADPEHKLTSFTPTSFGGGGARELRGMEEDGRMARLGDCDNRTGHKTM